MAADIWSVADLLRGDYRRHEYGQVILPFTVLRRLDAVMAPTRQAVRDRDAALTGQGIQNKERPLQLAAKLPFYNTSKQDFSHRSPPTRPQVAKNLRDYIAGFSENVRKIIERFELDNQITRLAEAKLLYQVVGRFAAMRDLDEAVRHTTWATSSSTSSASSTRTPTRPPVSTSPRARSSDLMVNLLIAPDRDTISGEGQVINILDPACGTGGMLDRRRRKDQLL